MGIISVVLTRAAMLPIVILLLCTPARALLPLTLAKLPLPNGVTGPACLTFDSLGGGPYVGVKDGRILKYQGPAAGFIDFSFVTATRTNGGLATSVARGVNGVPFNFLFGVAVDPLTGDVYFTQYSSVFKLRDITQAIVSGDATGSLLKYDPRTNQVTVLLTGLSGTAGVVVSADGTYLLVSQMIGHNILRFWIKGPKINTTETFMTFQGRTSRIKRFDALGSFLVALDALKTPKGDTVPTWVKINSLGIVLELVALDREFNNARISEVLERSGAYYVASRDENFLGVYL